MDAVLLIGITEGMEGITGPTIRDPPTPTHIRIRILTHTPIMLRTMVQALGSAFRSAFRVATMPAAEISKHVSGLMARAKTDEAARATAQALLSANVGLDQKVFDKERFTDAIAAALLAAQVAGAMWRR